MHIVLMKVKIEEVNSYKMFNFLIFLIVVV